MGEFISRRSMITELEHLQGGLIIDMPETGVEDYLRTVLDLDWLPSDEDLINHLETLLEQHRERKRIQGQGPFPSSSSNNA
jgi:hypothetical protein